MKVIGLTGGIGSGKSTVACLLLELHVPVVDADALSRMVMRPGRPAFNEIATAWPDVVDSTSGVIDRARLAAIVFNNPEELQKLEWITHPRIQEEARLAFDVYEANGEKLAFYEVPLLFEKKMQDQFEATLLVTSTREQQLERIMKRNTCTREEALTRVMSQMQLHKKVALADHLVDNSGDVGHTRQQVKDLVWWLRLR